MRQKLGRIRRSLRSTTGKASSCAGPWERKFATQRWEFAPRKIALRGGFDVFRSEKYGVPRPRNGLSTTKFPAVLLEDARRAKNE